MALFILPDQDIDGMFAWKKMSDGEPLVNATALNYDSIVGVNLKNRIRTDTNKIQFFFLL
jgi:hypothetical protein